MQIEELIVGGSVILIVAAILLALLPIIALWRIGTGTLLTAQANIRIAKALQDLRPGDEEIRADLAKVEHGKEIALAAKDASTALAGVHEQVKLAVQWYVHSLQPPAEKPAKK